MSSPEKPKLVLLFKKKETLNSAKTLKLDYK